MVDELRRNLEEVFSGKVTYELILTTIGRLDARNAAPIGVRRTGGNLVIDLAEETLSLGNLRSSPRGVLNVVHDPLIFAQAAFNTLPDTAYSTWRGSNIPIIRDADVAIEVRVVSESPITREDHLGKSRFFRLTLRPIRVEVRKKPKPVSRRTCAAIEAIVSVTKAEVATQRGLLHLLPEYQEAVSRAESVADRSGSDPSTDKVFEMCKRRLDRLTQRPVGSDG